MRSPCTAMKSSPRSPQLEKACTQQRRPNAAKKKKPINIYWLFAMQFLGTIQKLRENIQMALFYGSRKTKEEKKKREREDIRE